MNYGLEDSNTPSSNLLQQIGYPLGEPTGDRGAVGYIHILQQLPPTLALDISKSSTGWATWDGKELKTGTFREMNDIEDHTQMRKAFRNFVLELYKTADFQYVIIEDVIGSVNFDTANKLYQLNPIVDDMMEFGMIPTGEIFREDNGTWRKHLKRLADWTSPIRGFTNTKVIVQQSLDNMYVPRIWTNDNESDSIGMLLGTVAFRLLGFTLLVEPVKVSTNINRGYNLKQFKTKQEIDKYLSKHNPEKIKRVSIVGEHTDIFKKAKELLSFYGGAFCYVVETESEKASKLIIDNIEKGFEFTSEPCYIVFSHKKTYKQKD